MARYYYKTTSLHARTVIRMFGLSLSLLGLFILVYVFFPLVSWQVYFAPLAQRNNFTAPIPKTIILTSNTIQSLIQNMTSQKTFNSEDAKTWFPNIQNLPKNTPKVPSYSLSIPKLGIKNAIVSTLDYDIGKHLINYGGTALPGENGNAVIIGHSTLPQLFDPRNYHTIFANAYQLTPGDEFFATVDSIQYRYKIVNINVVEPNDTTPFAQTSDNSYITIITCTPPGTIWKRLVVKAALQKI